MSIRVLIADDHAVVRQGLRMFLALDPDLEVVGDAENGSEAVRLAKELRPDVVLMDMLMPVMDGVAATGAIRQALPAGWRLEENGLHRTLFAGEIPVTVIEYSGEPRWSGIIELHNLRYHYRLVIQSVSNGP